MNLSATALPSGASRRSCVLPVHTTVPGRARFKIVGLRRSKQFKVMLEERLSSRQEVLMVVANPLTGSLLVVYHSAARLEEVIVLVEHVVRTQIPSPPPEWSTSPLPKPESISSPKPDWDLSSLFSSLRALLHWEFLSSLLDWVPSRSRPAPRALAATQDSRPWHLMETDDVLHHWGVLPSHGYSAADARAAMLRYGTNALPPPESRSALAIFAGQFQSLPVALLGVSAAVSAVTGGIIDAAVLLTAVLINATIGFVTESQAERTVNSLVVTHHKIASLLREGRIIEVEVEAVVPGDIMALTPGNYVCADARLLEVNNLSVDESALTGESLPVRKALERLTGTTVPLGDRVNMVYMGTTVTGGSGVAVVVATATSTEIGRIQQLLDTTHSPETPMERQLEEIGNQLVMACGAVCIAVFGLGLLRGHPFLEILKGSISLAVGAVPEGLPTVATTTLALGVAEMRRHHVLVRQMDAVESLGAVQVICLDKTGTLTLNRMSVVGLRVGGQSVRLRHGRFSVGRESIDPRAYEGLRHLLRTVALCNDVDVEINDGEGAPPTLKGSPTEMALVWAGLEAGLDVAALRTAHPRLAVAYRSEGRNYMATVHSSEGGARHVAIKGSPSEVLTMCRSVLRNGTRQPLTDTERAALLAANEDMAGEGLRVLGVAYGDLAPDESSESLGGKLVWLGLVAMADPTREGMRELIGQFHQAGIDTVMITGDQSATAYAIGKELHLARNGHVEILDSSHLEQVNPEVLAALAQHVNVFARVSPANKLQIVQALQRSGQVVAMTGDGINDGPALKAANIGVAMGGTGTDAARAVAGVVLEDDNLNTLIHGIAQGRTIYSNIRKSLRFLLSTNFSEILVMLGAISTGLGIPLNTMQLLWINLLSDIFPGLALAAEPAEPEVMARPPRNPAEPILRREDLIKVGIDGGVISAAALGAYGYGVARYGIGPQASTLAFSALTTAQLLHALSCRSEVHSLYEMRALPPNGWLQLALGGSMAIQGLALTLPPLRNLLGLAPVSIVDLLVAGAGATLPLFVIEGLKHLNHSSSDLLLPGGKLEEVLA
ncbi:ATPase [Gammaproteobacteria bacterium]